MIIQVTGGLLTSHSRGPCDVVPTIACALRITQPWRFANVNVSRSTNTVMLPALQPSRPKLVGPFHLFYLYSW